MKTTSLFAIIASALLCSCEGYPQPGQVQSGMYQRVPPPTARPNSYGAPPPRVERSRDYGFPSGSDYQPELSRAYRLGFQFGADDAYAGRPRNSSGAFRRSGSGYESYFQEGYADGYDGRRPRH